MTKVSLHPSFAKSALVTTTTVVGTRNEDGTANYTAIAWAAPCNGSPFRLCVSMNAGHLGTENILREKTFTVNVGNVEMMKEVNRTGTISGRKESKEGLFETVWKENGAPAADNLPVNVQCKLVDKLDQPANTLLVGEVTGLDVDEECTAGRNIDLALVNPLLFSFGKCNGAGPMYASLGKAEGIAWAQDPAEKLKEKQT